MSLSSVLQRQTSAGYLYQEFDLDDGGMLVPGEKMTQKLGAFGSYMPDVIDGAALDLGSNLGFWSWLCAERGASEVVGVETSAQRIAWCHEFQRETTQFGGVRFTSSIADAPGPFALILCFSVYHHLWGTRRDHDWWMAALSSRLAPGGVMLHEGPFDDSDYIIRGKFPGGEWKRDEIEAAFTRHFSRWECIGGSGHASTREAVVLWK